MKHILVWILCGILFAGCNPDLAILHPLHNKPQGKPRKIIFNEDTLLVTFTYQPFQPLFFKNDSVPANLPFHIRSMVFNSANGNQLNGWMVKPLNGKPTITLLYFHGNSGNLLTNLELITPMVNFGFQVFMIDYSGFGLSQGKATRKNTLTDALSAIDFVSKLPMIKGTKLIVYGQSYGGHLSAVAGTMKQQAIDGMVLESAFTSYHDIMTGFWGFLGRQFLPELYRGIDTIPNFHKPILIIHSREDATVPFAMGQQFFDKANQPKAFYTIDGRHVYGPKLYASEIAERIKNMLETND